MATALADTFEPTGDEAPQDDAGGAPERDYEAEARQHGWTPKEEFKGDPARWVDATTFVERADSVLPFVKKQNKALKIELEGLKRDIKRATEHFSKAEERAYERALAELTAKQDAAAEVGDVAGVQAVRKEIAELKADLPTAQPADLALEAKEAEIDWRERNPWYDKGGLLTDYANLLVEKHKAKTSEMAPAEFFDFIGAEVLKRYPDAGKTTTATERKPINPVEGSVTNRRAAGGKGWADMDPEERRMGQAMAARWVKSGLLKKADDFLLTYDWSKK
jgi:hypothetical protein